MKQPLAYRLKPKCLNDVIGQKHLVGENGIIRKLADKHSIFSMIFYGPPGIGKTSIAIACANELKLPYRMFNAVKGNKKDLEILFEEAKLSGSLIVIVDEVHRLNKDKQDLLLPHIEDGSIIMLGATTANPYFAINPAIRSRTHLFELKPLGTEDIIEAINKAIKSPDGLNNEYTIDDDASLKIANTVNGDIRFALNILEIAARTSDNNHITLDDVMNYTHFINQRSFKDDDEYYNLLSAFQKSIRGSDVNAALYYLAMLAKTDDLESILRRMLVIGYEEVGLANPALAARGISVADTARQLGFPEALGPISVHVIDLCLAPKSKAGYDAGHNAFDFVDKHTYDMPDYLNFTPVNPEVRYDYSRYDCFHKIQYLPTPIKDIEFVNLGNSQYETMLKKNYDELKKTSRTTDLKKLYQNK